MRRLVCLDTNVWSWIANDGPEAVHKTESVIRRCGGRIAVPPAIILEAARAEDLDVRAKILRAVCGGPRAHMRTEADTCCAELVAEIRRLRPVWMRAKPDVQRIDLLRRAWIKEIPRRALRHPELINARDEEWEGVRNY